MAAFGACDGVEARAVRGAPGEDAGARGRADGAARVAIGEADSFLSEGVEVRGLDDGVAVAAEIGETEVVSEVDDDVGLVGCRENGGEQGDGEEDESLHDLDG